MTENLEKIKELNEKIIKLENDLKKLNFTITIDEYTFTIIGKYKDGNMRRDHILMECISNNPSNETKYNFNLYRSNSEGGILRLCHVIYRQNPMYDKGSDYVTSSFVHLNLQQFVLDKLDNVKEINDDEYKCNNEQIKYILNDEFRIIEDPVLEPLSYCKAGDCLNKITSDDLSNVIDYCKEYNVKYLHDPDIQLYAIAITPVICSLKWAISDKYIEHKKEEILQKIGNYVSPKEDIKSYDILLQKYNDKTDKNNYEQEYYDKLIQKYGNIAMKTADNKEYYNELITKYVNIENNYYTKLEEYINDEKITAADLKTKESDLIIDTSTKIINVHSEYITKYFTIVGSPEYMYEFEFKYNNTAVKTKVYKIQFVNKKNSNKYNLIFGCYDYNGKNYKIIINMIPYDSKINEYGVYDKICSVGIFIYKPFEYSKQLSFSRTGYYLSGDYQFIGDLLNKMYPLPHIDCGKLLTQ